uniref:ATP synthase F0 subunit 8 n=1 Tax=Bombus pyrosoma TaxID=396416 RepID=A0A482JM37_9HYME|nr:ATP synthase F0 subunit 8 [Bombus pyrosoma]
MMPINWMIIFVLCLLSLIIIIIMMNSMLLYFKMNYKYNLPNKINVKKWNWLW